MISVLPSGSVTMRLREGSICIGVGLQRVRAQRERCARWLRISPVTRLTSVRNASGSDLCRSVQRAS